MLTCDNSCDRFTATCLRATIRETDLLQHVYLQQFVRQIYCDMFICDNSFTSCDMFTRDNSCDRFTATCLLAIIRATDLLRHVYLRQFVRQIYCDMFTCDNSCDRFTATCLRATIRETDLLQHVYL